MLSDHRNDGTGENPLAGGCAGIIVIDCTAGRVASVNRVTGSFIGRVCNRCIDAAIIQTGKSTGLINDTGQGVGKAGVGNTV